MEISVADCPAAAPAPLPPGSAPVLELVPHERDDTGLSVDELGARIVGLAARLAAATCRWLRLVAQFDTARGYERHGLGSTARWLSHACGISHRTAVEHVRVARALLAHPALADALSAGRISYSHVRAITRLTHPEPEPASESAGSQDQQVAGQVAGERQVVTDLLQVAEHGTVGQLETMVRGLRTVESHRTADTQGPPAIEEYVRPGWSARSSHWTLSARLDPDKGALLERALHAIAAAEDLTPADALTRLGEITLAALTHAAASSPSGSSGSSRSSLGPPRGLRGHERAAVLIHLTPADLTPADADQRIAAATPRSAERGTIPAAAAPGDTSPSPSRPSPSSPDPSRPFARLDNGPGLTRRTTEWLLCHARLRTVLHDHDGSVLDLGRSHRVVTDKLYRALLLRDRHCTHPGCTATHRLEAHHVRHWLYGGPTNLDNLVLLCPRHHHAHHDGAFTIGTQPSTSTSTSTGTGPRFVFRRADGRVLPAHIDAAQLTDTTTPIENEHPHIPDRDTLTRSTGDRLDHHWAIAVLATRRANATAPGSEAA